MSAVEGGPMSTSHPGAALPWSDDPRAADKTRIFKRLLYEPAGLPIATLVEDLFGADQRDGDSRYQREYKFARRFLDSSPFFLIDGQQDVLHAHPQPAAFHLTGPKHYSNTDAVPRFPKDWTESYLETVGDSLSTTQKETIECQFFEYLEQIHDRWNILRNTEPEPRDHDYLLVPYATLFNSESRADDNWRRYHQAWDRATERYDVGVQVTLTTDPAKFSSIKQMADEIGENFNRFMSWLKRRLADRCDEVGEQGHNIRRCTDCEEYAERPDYVRVLEWTEKGRPHLHVVIFGVDWLVHQEELANYWDRYQGRIVDIRQVRNRDGNWLSKEPETGTVKNEKAHLGKYLSKQMPTDESLDELQEAVGGEDGLWKTAMYWATGKRFWTCSEDLKEDVDEDGALPELPKYVHVGAAHARDIPAHVIDNALFLLPKPPPD